MPGHAGHLLARLFGLSHEVMPLLGKQTLERLVRLNGIIPQNFDRLELYRFSKVEQQFDTWQNFHRGFADYKDLEMFRKLEVRNKFPAIIFPIHPFEFHFDIELTDNYDYYYVDLDLDTWGTWVSDAQEKLGFAVRPDEHYYFNKYQVLHNMKPIHLTKMLTNNDSFSTEYLRVAESMNLTPMLDQAQILFNDWKSVRL